MSFVLANTRTNVVAAAMRQVAVVCPGIEAKRGDQPDHTGVGGRSG